MALFGMTFCMLVVDARLGEEVARQVVLPRVTELTSESFQVRQKATARLLTDREFAVQVIRYGPLHDLELLSRIESTLISETRRERFRGMGSIRDAIQWRCEASGPLARAAAERLQQRLERRVDRVVLDVGGKLSISQGATGMRLTRVTFYRIPNPRQLSCLSVYPRLHLVLSGPAIEDSCMSFVKHLNNVEVLDLRYTGCGPQGLAAIATCSQLRSLYLSRTRVSDRSLLELEKLVNLESLFLSDTGITDACVPALKRHVRLKTLSITGTQISPRGLRQLQLALPGCHIRHSIAAADE